MIIDTNEHELAPEESAKGELLVYQTEDGTVKLEVRLENETIWLTQQMMAEFFQTTKQNIGQHLKNIFEEGELEPNSVVKKFFTTAVDGKRYNTSFYNLDADILAKDEYEQFAQRRREYKEIVGQEESIRHLEEAAKLLPKRKLKRDKEQ